MIYNPFPEGQYRITQWFGQNVQYYKKMYGMNGHNGYDFGPPTPGQKGVIVCAPHEGYVSVRDEGNIGYGRHVEILGLPYDQAGQRKKSTLAHFESFLVEDGQFVGSGDPIGIMGNTGDSTGIHCHWTPKRADRDGNSMNKDNGFFGALRIGPYVLKWVDKKLEA